MSSDRRSEDEVAPTLAASASAAESDAGGDATLPASSPASSPGASGPRELVAGHKLGRYEIEHLIGRGGMGEVYAAYDPNLDRPVAVKVLLGGVRDEAAALRLVREAQALARLQHPNVVAVYDAGEDRGQVFLAMQFVEGETLATHLRARARPWAEVVALFVEAGRGLAAAHAAGIIHRDFKPTNVLVDTDGHVAVTDFGLARESTEPATTESQRRMLRSSARRIKRGSDPVITPVPQSGSGSASADLTRQGELVGTPAYMPVEQIAGTGITAATDQFAFCVALWEALFGAHPFLPPGTTDGSALAFVAAIEQGVIVAPTGHRVPRPIVAALTRGLSREASARWPSMDALLAVLAPKPPHRRWLLVAGGAVVVGAVVVAALALRADAPPPCGATARTRIAAIWGPAQRDLITTRFGATGLPYATTAATSAHQALDGYAELWTAATTDACTAGRAGDDVARARAAARLACLDRAHTALAGTIGVFTDPTATRSVDAVAALVAALPAIQDCTGGETAGTPPPAIAARLPALEGRLRQAVFRVGLGEPQVAAGLLEELARDSADVAWEPYQARLAYERAATALELNQPTYAEMTALIERAKRLKMYRLQFQAAASAMQDAPDLAGLDAAVAAALDAAAALHNPEVSLEVAISHGLGLNKRRKFAEAASLCRDARKTAHEHQWLGLEDRASTCLMRALLPLSQYGELAPLVDERLASLSTRLGLEHPRVATLLQVKANLLQNQGKFAEAGASLERALAIVKRSYGDHDLRVAGLTRDLAGVSVALDDYEKGQAQLEAALAIIMALHPPPDGELWQTHRDLAMLWMNVARYDRVRYHFDEAVAAATRQNGAASVEVAFLLLVYGQYQSAWDVDTGIKSLRHAIDLFEQLHDPRTGVARGALGNTLVKVHRYREAIEVLEAAVGNANLTDTPPLLLGQMHWALAQALLAEKRMPVHARQHAEDALAHFANSNDLGRREEVRDWIKDRHLPPYKSDQELRAAGTPIPEHEAGRLTP